MRRGRLNLPGVRLGRAERDFGCSDLGVRPSRRREMRPRLGRFRHLVADHGGRVEAAGTPQTRSVKTVASYPERRYDRFDIEVLVNGVPREQYAARGRRYIEAINGAEYELRIHNPLPMRVAVALSVDGLNTINARHTSAWLASKWVIGPYQTINISGWQVSNERARHFYFTTERDSYGAKLGQTANLGVISAVFFREQYPVSITGTPQPRRERPPYEEDKDRGGR